MKRFPSLLFAVALAGCSYGPLPLVPTPVVVPTPAPSPAPAPTPVVVPKPPQSNAVPYATVQQIVKGMTYDELVALVGREPDRREAMPTLDYDVAWEAVDEQGGRRLLVVRLDEANLVVSRVLF